MFPARTFANKKVGVFGLARSGTACAEALRLGGAEVFAWDDRCAVGREGEAGGLAGRQICTRWISRRSTHSSSAPACRLTHPKPHWTVEKAKDAGIEIIGDTEVFQREIARQRRQAGGDHRHQRQVDDDGARRPSFRCRRTRCRCRRQYRQGRVSAAPAGQGPGLCAGTVVLPDRSDAEPQARCRHTHQHHARSSRPTWHDGELCCRQGAHVRQADVRATQRSSASTRAGARRSLKA